jgi:hypothetical protein
MSSHRRLAAHAMLLAALGVAAAVQAQAGASPAAGTPILVTPDNFVRAETDHYFSGVVRDGGFARWYHAREPAPVEQQPVIRLNRDTLYSSAVFDLDAGPVTITLPDAGGRFMSLQVINQDQYTLGVHYRPGSYTLTRQEVGTRYVVAAVRTLVDPADPNDVRAVHALQDAIRISQEGRGNFEVPNWDQASLSKVRNALLVLASTLPDTSRMYGNRDEVDPVRFLIGAAQGWGGNPAREALYLNVVPSRNDGSTVYRLNVREVPVDGFWSISVYNAEGYFEPNRLNAYSLNNVTAKRDGGGSITVQFGGCDGQVLNCLPVVRGWNYMVRLYRPRPEILSGAWRFPEAQPTE